MSYVGLGLALFVLGIFAGTLRAPRRPRGLIDDTERHRRVRRALR